MNGDLNRSKQLRHSMTFRFCCRRRSTPNKIWSGWWFEPSWKILVNGKDCPIYYGKMKNVPKHQPEMDNSKEFIAFPGNSSCKDRQCWILGISIIRIHAVYLGVSEIAQKTTTVGRLLKRGRQHWMLRLRRPDDTGRKLPVEVAEKDWSGIKRSICPAIWLNWLNH